MTEEQWNALLELIKFEAKYAADERFNYNDCGTDVQRIALTNEVKDLFVSR